MIDRREFFSGFWKRRTWVRRSIADRKLRNKELEAHVQTHLLPADFALTVSEESYLWSRVRSVLEETNDADLFSTAIVKKLRLLVGDLIEPWRMASEELNPIRQPETLRQSAIEKAVPFLQAATDAEIDALQTKFSLTNRVDLESHLRGEIATWIRGMEDAEIMKHDSFSIQDPVFAHLRALCR